MREGGQLARLGCGIGTDARVIQTVLLTGASEGMGLAVAEMLSAKGANLILVSRSVGKLEEAVQKVKVRSTLWPLRPPHPTLSLS